MKQIDIFNGLPEPRTNTQEVLFTLITQDKVSIFDYPYLSGFRTRVSELQLTHEVAMFTEMIQKVNKFGNCYRYALHHLINKEKAIQIYKKLCKNNKS